VSSPPAPVSPIVRPRNAVAVGVGLMLLGDFMFAANDVMGKWLIATFTVGQVLLIRSAAALIFMIPMVMRLGVRNLVGLERPRTQVLRVLFATFEVLCFYWAVVYVPVADVMVFYLAGPIYVAALSPWMLGERVGWRRWTAILVGFVGVIIVLEPSTAALTLPSLISLAGSFAFALVIIQSRQLRRTPDTAIVFWQTAGALVAGAVLAPFGWVTPDPAGFGLLALLGVVAMIAHVLINRALKYAPAVVLAPIQYTLLLWAVVFGYLVFGDVPETRMLVGAAIIILAGLFLFHREKVRKRETAPPGDLV
jgi:drug/metabolite transporter (DMT)-like permease